MDTIANFNTPFPPDNLYRELVTSVKEYAIFMIDPDGLIKSWNDGAKNIKGYDVDEIIGKHISLFYTKEDVDRGLVAQILEAAKKYGSFEDEGWRVRKDGTLFWADVISTALYNKQHQLTGYAKVTRDISNQKKEKGKQAAELTIANTELVFQNEEKGKRADELTIANTELAFQNEEKEKRAAELIIANTELVFQNEEKGKRADELIVANTELAFQNEEKEKLAAELIIANTELVFQNEEKEKRALAMVSNITEKKLLEEKLIEQVIQEQKNITKAVVNAQEKERAEIGMELHDNINQLLAASNLYLGHGLSQPDYAPFILQGQECIVKAMEEIRKLSHILVGPAHEKTMGLIASVKELINNISIVKDIKISFNYSTYAEEESEIGLKLVMYRIIQEQMSNILKHAEASEVEIELKKEGNDLILIINDNGKGFDTSARRKGIGLKNIKNRAEVYDGTVQIICPPGNGCKMKIVFKTKSNEKA